MKVCKQCGKRKRESSFYPCDGDGNSRHNRPADGLRYECKACGKENAKTPDAKAALRKRSARWKKLNRERHNAQFRAAYARRRKYFLERNRRFREANPDYQRQWRARRKAAQAEQAR